MITPIIALMVTRHDRRARGGHHVLTWDAGAHHVVLTWCRRGADAGVQAHNMSSFADLETLFEQRLLDMLKKQGTS